MFFNTKHFELVDLTNQNVLEINSINTLTFYIKDITLNTEIQEASYMISTKSGRDTTVLKPYTSVTDITGDIIKIEYTPTIDTADKELIFRIKIIDNDSAEHLLITNSYTTTLK